jgi:EAL domain-containing protein (putative c-di-GMP-specific phosphodiesterase class I)
LREVGLEGKHLNIEITESVFIDNVDTVCKHMEAIRSMGIGLHLDDFGTGYSSLSSFHKLPIDAVKIDRSFVANMMLDGRVANIVQAIQIMASNRSMKVIAEGIETIEQLLQLQTLGCECGQGYYMSRPIDAVAAQELLKTNSQRLKGGFAIWPQANAA